MEHTNAPAVLSCESLCLGYEDREVLHGLSFTLRQGECLAVLGENGAGKSTLLAALLGLKKPNHGRVVYGAGLTRRQIGYLPQHGAVQKDFPATAGEVVRSGLLGSMGLRARYGKRQRARAGQAMAQMGIERLDKQCFRELSGGQQRRVLLARALAATQKLLLLDEPDAGLDPVAAGGLREAIAQLHRARGIAVVLVSHDVGSALREADFVLHLANGGGRFFGTPDAYRQSPLGMEFLRGQ
ncbi:MAG: ATP-binding cassette domain-containing protein [Oscillospiraceae bacterium]|jgi:zinc transport system ATP-binding protein|nr:ATP-binding cassette domain-containing protein [Oscillospiraceae bacterium]